MHRDCSDKPITKCKNTKSNVLAIRDDAIETGYTKFGVSFES